MTKLDLYYDIENKLKSGYTKEVYFSQACSEANKIVSHLLNERKLYKDASKFPKLEVSNDFSALFQDPGGTWNAYISSTKEVKHEIVKLLEKKYGTILVEFAT